MTRTTDEIARVVESIRPERVIGLAERLCSAPFDPGGEGPRAEMIADALDHPGIDVHLEDVVAGRPNVIATVEGAEGPPLVLQGHIDAGIYPDGWSRDPTEAWKEGNRLYGGGINDMLGAVAAMVAAVEAAPHDGFLPGDLILHATMHHDGTGLGSKYALFTDGPRGGYGICGEPSDMAIHTANGGAFKFEVTLHGSSAHISRMEHARDVLPDAVRVYEVIREHSFSHTPEPRLPDLPRVLVGQLEAGRGAASVAERATIRGDVRSVPGMTRRQVAEELRSLVSDVVSEGLEHRVRITGSHQPFLGATSGPLITAISAAHLLVRGDHPRITNELPGQAFVTDAADLAAAGLESVVYGVGDWHAAPDQWVDVNDLVDSSRIYLAAALILRNE